MNPDSYLNPESYLRSLCETYAQWWNCYTLTDVLGKKQDEEKMGSASGVLRSPLFDFGLMVETVKKKKESKEEILEGKKNKESREEILERKKNREEKSEKRERLTVLDGLRKYANNHVLLVGRPGSGKSTALMRWLLEEAQNYLSGKQVVIFVIFLMQSGLHRIGSLLLQEYLTTQIPILVELRFYQTSILDLIRDFLKRHDPNLPIDGRDVTCNVSTLLRQGKFLLLMDGVNELPSEEARRDLRTFRQNYQKTTPMVFTTRDLGVGGDLGLEKKLQMQPLTEEQMREFVCAYLPEQGEDMLKQLKGRLREFGQTPLLLWMLCSVFTDNQNKVPAKLGSVFRRFTEIYDKQLKQDIPVTDESRRWWKRLLQHLAWVMTQGGSKTEILVAIPKQQARDILTQFLQEQNYHQPRDAEAWLDDLLKHHLIELGAENQIQFRHQLLQEYYTAERLLQEIPKLSDYELQWEYLNYLKWTEPIALMMQLLNKPSQVVDLVKLALEVDLQLGARLAGEVKAELQEETVGLIDILKLHDLLKIKLFGLTKSDTAIPLLSKLIQDSETYICKSALDALGEINSEQAKLILLKALKHPDSNVRSHSVWVLSGIANDLIVSELITALNDEDDLVRYLVVFVLGRIGSEAAVKLLIKVLENYDDNLCFDAIEELKKIGSPPALNALHKSFKQGYRSVQFHCAKALSELDHQEAINYFKRIARFQLALGGEEMRRNAAFDLAQIGDDIAIPELNLALEDEDQTHRWRSVIALSKIKSNRAVNALMSALKDEDYEIRWKAAEILEKITFNKKTPELIQLLNNEDWRIRWRAVNSLNINSNDEIINKLILVLNDEDFTIRWKAVEILGKSGDHKIIPKLTKLLVDKKPDVRAKVVESLGKLGHSMIINHLIKALDDREEIVRQKAAEALVKNPSNKAVPALVNALNDENIYVRSYAAEALEIIGCDTQGKSISNPIDKRIVEQRSYSHYS